MSQVAQTLGIVAYVAFTLSLCGGILRTFARQQHHWYNWALDELHEFAGLMGWLLALGHVLAVLGTPGTPFGVLSIVFMEPLGHPAAVWGATALWLLMAVIVGSWLRGRLGPVAWKGIHALSYAAFVALTIHGWLAGPDTATPWMQIVYGVATALVLLLAAVRAIFHRQEVVV